MNLKRLFTLILLVLPVILIAQEIEIKGRVTSSDGMPLAGTTVLIKGGNVGTVTDIDGEFSLNASRNDIILFSFLGFKTIERQASLSFMEIILEEDYVLTEEIVVVGYGTQRKIDMTGSVSSLSGDALLTALQVK